MKKIVIGITDCSKFLNYERWVLSVPGVEVIRLGYRQDNFQLISQCDGIVLTGGEDLHPEYYGHPEYLEACHRDDMDLKRDEFEWKVLQFVADEKLPLLGICRGMQISNAWFGGTLIPDIVSCGKSNHAKTDGIDRYHPVTVRQGSYLSGIVGIATGEVNSAHHQSVDAVGKGLRITATSEEGVIEGLERDHPEGHPFLQLVQWHPERMREVESPLAKNIRDQFLKSAEAIYENH